MAELENYIYSLENEFIESGFAKEIEQRLEEAKRILHLLKNNLS